METHLRYQDETIELEESELALEFFYMDGSMQYMVIAMSLEPPPPTHH